MQQIYAAALQARYPRVPACDTGMGKSLGTGGAGIFASLVLWYFGPLLGHAVWEVLDPLMVPERLLLRQKTDSIEKERQNAPPSESANFCAGFLESGVPQCRQSKTQEFEMNPPTELLTEQEAAVYDRQIRVWGVDAQRKLSKARVLVVGMSGVVAETCKNIVLAGIGSLTLVDDSRMTLEASAANFLIQFDEMEGQGITVADACAASLRDYNPMVHVKSEAGSIQSKPDNFFDNFDAVILGRSSVNLKRHVNEVCRKQSHRITFYAVDCRGTFGSLFVDLKTHSYTSKRAKDDKDAQHELSYPSLEEALGVPWNSFPRRTSKLLFALRCLEDFEQAEGRQPGHVSVQDLPAILAFWKKACEAQKVSETLVSETLFQKLLSAGSTELPPVCAIMGGIVGQELIKAMSSKGEPLKNYFFFDAADGKGIIEKVVPKEG